MDRSALINLTLKKPPRPIILSQPAVLLALIVAFALVAGTVLMTAYSTRGIVAANERAAHAQRTLVLTGQVLATLTEAEIAQRSYVQTGDENDLAPHTAAQARYGRELNALQQQLSLRPEVAPLLVDLQGVLSARFAELARTVRLRRESGLPPAPREPGPRDGWRATDEIRGIIQTLQSEELDALAGHTGTLARRAESFQSLGLGLIELAVALTTVGAWLLLRRVRSLEQLITVCAWTRRVLWQGRWISFEEYLALRFQLHCTHGICEEAARQMEKDARNTPPPDEPGHQETPPLTGLVSAMRRPSWGRPLS